MNILIYSIVFLVSYAAVKWFRRWIQRREIFDVPNERSSHTEPTARGGGLIIVLVCLTAYTIYTNVVTRDFQWSYLTGAVLIALISWLDDLYSVSFVWRFLIHAAAALLVIAGIGYFRELYLPFYGAINIGAAGAALTFLWIVWLTNAYNFMDGIDGIAGTQAITAGIGWLVIGNILGVRTIGFYGGVVAFSSLGFLIENWQPAKIFMGDVGSAFLGFSFAVFPFLEIGGENVEYKSFLPVVAVLLVWLFVFDTILTFIRRFLNGEKVWQAHRGHIYQRFIIEGYSHGSITILYGLLSAAIAAATALWLLKKVGWEAALFVLVLLESFGLFLFLVFLNRKRQKASV